MTPEEREHAEDERLLMEAALNLAGWEEQIRAIGRKMRSEPCERLGEHDEACWKANGDLASAHAEPPDYYCSRCRENAVRARDRHVARLQRRLSRERFLRAARRIA